MNRAFRIAAVLTAVLLSYALYEALVVAPTDQLQGDVYRIIYYHVPSAWTTFVFFTMNFVSSVIYLFRRSVKADAVAVAAAEVGVVFCAVVLVTGPLWARAVWGIWWTWDVRLTSTLVMWLIYISYLLLRRFSSGGQTPVLAVSTGSIWCARYATGLLLDLVFPDPAPATRSMEVVGRLIRACCTSG